MKFNKLLYFVNKTNECYSGCLTSPCGNRNVLSYTAKKQIKFRFLKTLKLDVFMLLHVVVIHPVSRAEICITGEIAGD
jgi:hypothetical protein